mgnify:FL=1
MCKKIDSLEWVKHAVGQPSLCPSDTINILLNTHFPGSAVEQINIPTNQADSCPTGPTQLDSLFTTQKTKWAIDSFEPYKSPGPDGLHPICLQLALPQITPVLQPLYKYCV